MDCVMEIFESGDYKFISELVEEKISILKNNIDFNNQYTRLYEVIDKLERNLVGRQKEQFEEVIELFYKTEEYYFALSYSLGVKYGEDLKKI